MTTLVSIREKFEAMSLVLNEQAKRLWVATEARSLGWGGVSLVAAATGMSRNTISAGLNELQKAVSASSIKRERIRQPGGGRKALTHMDSHLQPTLEALVEPDTRGDPESPLQWTCKSTSQLARELSRQGHQVSPRTVAHLLHEKGYSLQGNRKTKEGTSHPDRDQQFKYINRQVRLFQTKKQPIISVDTKKKELVGNFHNAGREWRPRGQPERVNIHDFRDPQVNKAIPYGVYDLSANVGWVNVGTDHDTPAFAVQSIRTWWRQMGSRTYPKATELLIMADCGGSNSYRARAWKTELQVFATESRLRVSVCHFPPGTSKWNKIEHRMFCHITQNWRGCPLVNYEVIVNLIGHTTTKTGLRIRAKLDRNAYPKGVKVDTDEMARVRIKSAKFHGEWNYTISPE